MIKNAHRPFLLRKGVLLKTRPTPTLPKGGSLITFILIGSNRAYMPYKPYPAYHSHQAYSPYRPPPATYCPPADSQRFFNRWPFSLQKAIFYNAKCRVLQCKTRHFKNTLIISYLQTTCIIRSNCALPHPAQTLKSISSSSLREGWGGSSFRQRWVLVVSGYGYCLLTT